MTLRTRLAIATAALVMPLTALAVAPGNVTGIKATAQGGKATVSWTPVTGQTIKEYRIHYSHESILRSNGFSDDYEVVPGTVSNYTFTPPPMQTFYTSILAVNTAGEESLYFAEEASVTLGTAASVSSASTASSKTSTPTLASSSSSKMSTASSASTPILTIPNTTNSSSAPGMAGQPQQLMKVEAISATGITLTFSQLVTVDQATAATAFTIRNASGTVLPLKRLLIQGKLVTLHTAVKQERGVVYAVVIGSGVMGKDANGTTVALDASQSPMLFTGHPTGTEPVKGSTQTPGTEVTGLTLRAKAEGKGYYTVDATWSLPTTSFTNLRVAQTTDGGRTYGVPTTLAPTTGGVSIPHVPASVYGLLVQVVRNDGTTSNGVLNTITLPGKVSGTTQGSVLPTGGTSGGLPQSGVGVFASILLAGSLMGFLAMRRLQTVRA